MTDLDNLVEVAARAIGDARRNPMVFETDEYLATAVIDALHVREMRDASEALLAKIDALADEQCGPFAIRNAVANSTECDALRALLNPQQEAGG